MACLRTGAAARLSSHRRISFLGHPFVAFSFSLFFTRCPRAFLRSPRGPDALPDSRRPMRTCRLHWAPIGGTWRPCC